MKEHEHSRVTINGEQWKEANADSLANAGPDAKVYSLDSETGTIKFGDGLHGSTPPIDSDIAISYRFGGGNAGGSFATISLSAKWPIAASSYLIAISGQCLSIRRTVNTVNVPSGEKRPRYYYGQLLKESDFTDEQNYFLAKLYRHNRLLHRAGVVQGLDLEGREQSVVLSPGLAIDGYGRELILKNAVELPISGDSPLYVTIQYAEKLTDDVMLTDPADTCPTRIEECLTICVVSEVAVYTALTIGRLVLGESGWHVDQGFERRTAS